VGLPPGSTPAHAGARRSRRRPIPLDLLNQASRRLQIIALLAAVLWVLSTVLYHVLDRMIAAGDTRWMYLQPSDGIVVIGVVLSLALYVYLRRGSHDPRFTLDLGLVYMIALAFLIGNLVHWEPVDHGPTAPNLSWNGVVVLLFAATLPNDLWKIVAAALVAASMNPIGMLIARARGTWQFDSALTAWTMHYPDFLVVIVAIVISRVVSGLGEQVARAREMGSYQLGELIGGGGMGEVYKATHRMLARPAAIKLIRPEILAARNGELAEIAVERFHREASAVAQLRSPHTVDLYDFGLTADGVLYFAMELLEGIDLETLVRQTGPLAPGRVVHILKQVCDSLEEAHASALVHRDIKPANIHIGRVGLRDDFVKVLDFGLVTSRGTATGRTELATQIGTVPGTPAYMAPEMALGDTIDGRADIYALGCVAYFLLTGQLVFETDNAIQSLVKRLNEEPVPPSQRTELGIPADLEALVLLCLTKSVEQRPTAADLGRQLETLRVEPWTDADAKHWWATHRPGFFSHLS
jgi:serine/threonine-protein kinase